MQIKKWNATSSQWEVEYPEVGVGAIVTSNSPSSTTFLRGDGQWAVPADVDNFLPLTGGTLTGTLTSRSINMQNYTLSNVGQMSFNDPGPNEGISWSGGNFKIYESPDNLTTNSAGNLQFVSGGQRRMTVGTDGGVYISGTLNATTISKSPTLTLSGDVTGSATFTNLGNATLTATVANNSHTHTIANVTNLQTELDGKLSTSGNAATASKLQNARNISLTGDVSGLVSFDGSSNVSMTTTIANALDSSGDTMTGDLTMAYDGPNTSNQGSHGIVFQGYDATFENNTFTKELLMDASGNLKYGTNTIFHSGNDGASSGLHADLLDGQQGSYYLDYNNFTNTPTIPTDTDTVTSIRRDNTGTYRTGNINLMSGSGVTITEVASGSFSFAASGGGATYSSATLYIKRIWSASVTSDEYTLRYNAGTGTGTAVSTSSSYTSIALGYTPASTDKFMIELSNNTSNSVEKGIAWVGHGTFSSTAGMSVISYDAYETVDSGQLKLAKYYCQYNISSSNMRFRYGSKLVW